MDFAEWPRRGDLERACAEVAFQQAFDNTMSAFHSPHNIPEAIARPLALYTARLLEHSVRRAGALLTDKPK
jgi:hypothetical protein